MSTIRRAEFGSHPMTDPDLATGIVIWETTVAAFLLKLARRLLPAKRLVVTETTAFFLDTDLYRLVLFASWFGKSTPSGVRELSFDLCGCGSSGRVFLAWVLDL